MTRKHYEMIAATLNELQRDADADNFTIKMVTAALAELFENDNPRFDFEKWLDACGYGYIG